MSADGQREELRSHVWRRHCDGAPAEQIYAEVMAIWPDCGLASLRSLCRMLGPLKRCNQRHIKRNVRVEGAIAYVPLTMGYEAIIDAADLPMAGAWNWKAQIDYRKDGSIRAVYAYRNSSVKEGAGKSIALHREVLSASPDLDVDHIDSDGLNNRRSNLRFVTKAQNVCNQRRRIDNTSGAKGVTWDKRKCKWRACIKLDGVQRELGRFVSFDDAAAAYATASQKIHGEFGRVS